MSERFDSSDEMAELRLHYHAGAGHLESFQSGAKQLRKGFGSGLTSGNANAAFYCAIQGTFFSIISGEKELTLILQEIDYYLNLLKTYKSEMTRHYLLCYHETVSLLIDKGEATGIEAKLCYGDVCDPGNKLLEVYYFHMVFRNYWLGYTERSNHYVQKYDGILQPRYFEAYIIKFYHGKLQPVYFGRHARIHSHAPLFFNAALNILTMLKKKKNMPQSEKVDTIIESMKPAASHADSNFRNKLELLEAEQYGVDNYHDKARASYAAAIASARKTKFIHEQGLACEKAGFYYKRMKDNEKSLEYFNQARECYAEWGSTWKVESIQRELDKLM